MSNQVTEKLVQYRVGSILMNMLNHKNFQDLIIMMKKDEILIRFELIADLNNPIRVEA